MSTPPTHQVHEVLMGDSFSARIC